MIQGLPSEQSPSPVYIPSPTIEEFIYAVARGPREELRMLILSGSRGEGKTSGAIYSLLALAMRMREEGLEWALPIRVACVRDTWVNLERALSADALVLTPTGWVKAGDVAAGDTFISQDGSPTTVLGVYPQGEQPLWRVQLSDGSSARVTGDHLWAVQGRWDREQPGARNRRCRREGWLPGPGGLRIVRTDQLRERLQRARRRQRAWSIPLVEPVQFPSRPVPIDPYILGALLGDGGLSSTSVRLSTADEEIVRRVRRRLPSGLTIRTVTGTRYDYAISGLGRGRAHPLKAALRELGLWGLRSPDKFIPDIYLWNDRDTRLAILRGLMDTDGCATRDRHVSFTSTSERLIDGVEFLVRSLGGLTKRSMQQFEPGEGHIHRGHWIGHRHPCWSLAIQMPPPCNPFALRRKARIAGDRQRRPWRWVVGIEQDGQGQAVCFRVAHPSGLFVMNDFVVTHNTTIVSFEENQRKGLPIEWRSGKTEAVIEFDRPLVHVYFFGLDKPEDADKLQGFACGVLWLEEVAPAAGIATGIPAEVLGLGATSVRQDGVPHRIIVTMNPPDKDHWIVHVEEHFAELDLQDIQVATFDIASGEKSRHFEVLAAEAQSASERERWLESARAFERYRRANKAFLEAIGRMDLVKRLVEGERGDVQIGEPVVSSFVESLHVPTGRVVVYRNLPLLRFWDGGGCYDGQTEVLTEHGWQHFRDLDRATRLATRHPQTGALEFQHPIEIVKKPYVGPMYAYESQNVNFLLTPAHRIHVFREQSKGWSTDTEARTPEDLASLRSGHCAVPLKAAWSGERDRRYGPHGWSGTVFAAFMGWYLAEGTARRNQRGPSTPM